MTRPILRAYLDETGDRGSSGKSSPFFAFACVLIADEDERAMRAVMSKLRADLRVPAGRPLHWKDHVKTFERRQHVTTLLTRLEAITINYTLVEKQAIPPAAAMRSDQAVFYNFAAGLALERVLLAARYWPGAPRSAVVRFGHVRGFDHRSTIAYFEQREAQRNPPYMPWHLLLGRPRFDDMAGWDGLQAADQYAGMLNAAIRPGTFGNYEPHHFLQAFPQLRRSPQGYAWNYGFKLLGNLDTLRAFPWWSQVEHH